VRALAAFRALGPIDLRSVGRDPLLRWLGAVPIALALVTRWFVPALVPRLSQAVGFDLLPYYRIVLAIYLLPFVPLLAGWVVGFLLLDERDDRTLAALQVTPLTLGGYVAYRLAVPTAASVALTLAVVPLSGVNEVGPGALLLAALAGAPLAPMASLYLAAFAANKVQGFALLKVSGIFALPPVIAYFVAPAWRPLFGIVPTFWAPAVYWTALEDGSGAGLYAAVGIAYQCGVVWLLLRRFVRSMRR